MQKLFLFILSFSVFISCIKDNNTGNGSLEDITSLSKYENQIKSGVSVLFFHATWCPKCAAQRPAVETLAAENAFQEVYFGQVNYEKVPDIITQYGVLGFPTIIINKNNVEKHRLSGQGHSQQKINDLIQSLL